MSFMVGQHFFLRRDGLGSLLFLALIIMMPWFSLSLSAATSTQSAKADAGNHPEAKSEAWTWMGHLNFYTSNDQRELSPQGVALLHYYTRNLADSGAMRGSMTFKTSALTYTDHQQGFKLDKKTTYTANQWDSYLRVRAGQLNIEWKDDREMDFIYDAPFELQDQETLERLMHLFPGLKSVQDHAPTKTVFNVAAGKNSRLNLNLYSIWPNIAPTGSGKIRFLGMDDTTTFSCPMIVASGTLDDKPVAGLLFLDRQWGTKYFGEKLFSSVGDMLKYGRALSFSHSWSAFHAYDPLTKEWSFFHLWRQVERLPGSTPDRLTDYSDLLWIKNGHERGHVRAEDYQWKGSQFVEHKGADVVLDYAAGQSGFFPSKFDLSAPTMEFEATLQASPKRQFQDQPIYLYEGYAAGRAQWKGRSLLLQGRVESSRILFRKQDYQEMLNGFTGEEQHSKLADRLRSKLRTHFWDKALWPLKFLWQRAVNASFLLHDLDLKIWIFGTAATGEAAKPDLLDPSVMIYR